MRNTSFYEKVFAAVGNEYEVVGKYISSKDKLLMRHVACGHEYMVKPNRFLCGDRCPKCRYLKLSTKMTKDTNWFKSKVKELEFGNEYTVLSEYQGTHETIQMRHNKCGHEYNTTPNRVLTKRRCPKCYGTPKKTNEWFTQEVEKLVGAEYSPVEEYDGNLKPIIMRHNVCGKSYKVRPRNFIVDAHRCPFCCDRNNSKGKLKIKQFLDENQIEFIEEASFAECKMKKPMRFDFFLPQFNLLIEFDGQQHFVENSNWTPLYVQQARDAVKNSFVNERDDYVLLRIAYLQDPSKILEDFLMNETELETFNDYLYNEGTVQAYWKQEIPILIVGKI